MTLPKLPIAIPPGLTSDSILSPGVDVEIPAFRLPLSVGPGDCISELALSPIIRARADALGKERWAWLRNEPGGPWSGLQLAPMDDDWEDTERHLGRKLGLRESMFFSELFMAACEEAQKAEATPSR